MGEEGEEADGADAVDVDVDGSEYWERLREGDCASSRTGVVAF